MNALFESFGFGVPYREIIGLRHDEGHRVLKMFGRTDLWRLAGNSIVPQVAAEVLRVLL